MIPLPSLRIGAAGFQSPDWHGVVYPAAGLGRQHPVEFLSRHVDTLEIGATFDAPLKAETARVWANRAAGNRRFQFTALLGRQFTYDRELKAEAIGAWKHGIWPLHTAGKLGAVILQFPWAFRYTAENRDFLIRLRRAFHEFPLAAEFRHESWGVSEALGTLVDYRIGCVNVDQPDYFRAMPPAAHLTTSVACVRLHGRSDQAACQGFDAPAHGSAYLYSAEELEGWQRRIERLAHHAERTFVTFTNSAGGRALVNAIELAAVYGMDGLRAPLDLIAHYPQRLAHFRAGRPVQPLLLEPALAVA